MAARECLSALDGAKQLFFGAEDVPGSQAERWKRARCITSSGERKQAGLDRRFRSASAVLRDGAAAFARQHALFVET
jgi:hypothetical protein